MEESKEYIFLFDSNKSQHNSFFKAELKHGATIYYTSMMPIERYSGVLPDDVVYTGFKKDIDKFTSIPAGTNLEELLGISSAQHKLKV